ncbi:MAG: winged helix-turn-helix transcriptional regulator [archaeon]
MKKLCLILFFLLFSLTVSSQDVLTSSNYEIIVLDETHALIKNKLIVDSSLVNSLSIPIYPSNNEFPEVKIYDGKGKLNFVVMTDSDNSKTNLIVEVSESKPNYALTIENKTNTLNYTEGSLKIITFKPLFDSSRQIVTIVLPENIQIKTFTPGGQITFQENKARITWNLSNNNRWLTVSFSEGEITENYDYLIEVIVTAITAIILVTILTIFIKFKRKNTVKELNKKQLSLLKHLPENEKKIVNLLFKQDYLTQRKLQLLTGMPKSSLSRTIKRLEKKDYLEIVSLGNTNKIKLKEWFFEK